MTANALQRFGQWWKANWPVLLAIATGVGAAVVGLVRWGGSLGEAVREARRKWRGPGDDPPREAVPRQRKPAEPKRSRGKQGGQRIRR